MMTNFRAAILTPLCLAGPSLSHANDSSGAYIGAAVEVIELESFDSGGLDFFPEATTTGILRGGYLINRYLAIEAEAAIGVDNQEDDGIANYESRFAGFARVRFPFEDTGFEVFARLGYATTGIESSNVIGSGDLTGITYGGGLAYNFGAKDQFQIRADYTEFNYGNSQDADAISFGFGYNF